MAKFLGPASLTDHWMTSSSVNHPHEEGFSRSFDSQTAGRSIKFLRIDDEPGPSGNGDVSLTFSSADELCTFLNGVRYAERLLKLESRLQKGVVKVKRARR
jgi:hypothetical protein